MSYVQICKKHDQYKGDYCGECIDDLYVENARLREALEKIASEDYRGNRPSSITIARAALEGK